MCLRFVLAFLPFLATAAPIEICLPGYITQNTVNQVTLFDVKTGTTIQNITVGMDPSLLSATKKHVYIPNSNQNTVSVLKIATNTITKTLLVGNGPYSVGIWNDYAYTVNQYDPSISIINTKTNIVENTITHPSLANPNSIAFWWKYGFITNSGNDLISILDTTKSEIVGSISLPDTGTQLSAIAVYGGFAYAASNDNTKPIYVIDLQTDFAISSIPSQGLVQNPNNMTVGIDAIFIANTSGNFITKINTKTQKLSKIVIGNLSRSPQAVAILGENLYSANDDGTVTIIDLTTNQQTMLSDPGGLLSSGTGLLSGIGFAPFSYDLVRVNAEGEELTSEALKKLYQSFP